MLQVKQVKSIAIFNKEKFFNYLKVESGTVSVTDFETFVTLKDATKELSDGFYIISTLTEHSKPIPEEREFPIFDGFNRIGNTLTIEAEAIAKIAKHASKDEIRPFLMSVCFQDKNIVATDGYTLKAIDIPSRGDFKESLVPVSSIEVLLKLCKLYRYKNVTIEFSPNYARVVTKDFEWESRLRPQEYIKWRAVVPKKFDKVLTISKWIDFNSLKPSMNKNKGYPSLIEVKNGEIIFSIPETDIVIKLGESEAEGLRLGFNASYLERASEGLKSFEIKVNSPLSPCLVNGCIVMPLKV